MARLPSARAREKRGIALELSAELGSEIAELRAWARSPATQTKRPRELVSLWALRLRSSSRAARLYEALNALKGAIRGPRNSRLPWRRSRLRGGKGVLHLGKALPAIKLASGDAANGRIFTLLHEFVHLLLHADGICDAASRARDRSGSAS